MNRIRVDTDQLMRVAKRLEQLGAEYDKTGRELVYQCNRVPSYGGQLSGPAHKAGAVAQYDANTLRDLLRDHSHRLMEIAKQFENVDGETVGQLGLWERMLLEMQEIATLVASLPSLEEIFGKYHQNQGDTTHCGDYSLSMVCNIYYDRRGESTSRCEVGNITDFLDKFFLRFPAPDKKFLSRDFFLEGGATPGGICAALLFLGIPFSFDPFGTIEEIEKSLRDGKIIMVSEGGLMDPKYNGKTWGHVMVIVGEEGDDFLLLDPSQPEKSGVTRVKKDVFLQDWWSSPIHPYWVIG